MKSFSQFLITEAFSRADLEKLRADAGAFSKNVRRIKNGRDLQTVCAAWMRWCTYASDMVYQRLMGLPARGATDYELKGETSAAKNLREKWWTIHLMHDIFMLGDIKVYGKPSSSAFTWRDGEPTYENPKVWDQLYDLFNDVRDTVYNKLGRAIREGFAALDQYFTSLAKDVVPDRAVPDKINVAGIPVVVVRDETGASKWGGDPRTAIRNIDWVVNQIRRMGMGWLLKSMHIIIIPNDTNFEVAGTYGAGEVTLYGKHGQSAHTVAHEIGHHVWYRLSDAQRKAWTDFYDTNRTKFTDTEIGYLHAAYKAAFAAGKAAGKGGFTIPDFWETWFAQAITDRTTLVKYQHFMISFGISTHYQRILMDPMMDETREEKWTEFLDQAKRSFLIFAPTEYANKLNTEAFCEVWAEYIVRERGLADIVEAILKSILNKR